jgi:hypothetical protein
MQLRGGAVDKELTEYSRLDLFTFVAQFLCIEHKSCASKCTFLTQFHDFYLARYMLLYRIEVKK